VNRCAWGALIRPTRRFERPETLATGGGGGYLPSVGLLAGASGARRAPGWPFSVYSTSVRACPLPDALKAVGVRQPDGEGNEHLAAPHEGVTADDLTAETERVLAELGENVGAVVLYRMKDNKPGEYDFVARVAATEFTPEYVKEQFGGGDYKVVVIDTVQGPLNPVFFSIDRRFVGKVWGSASPAAVVAQGTGDPFRDRMLEILLAKALTPAPAAPNSSKETIELVLAVVAAMKGGGDSANVMEQVSAMISTATTLAQAMNPPEGLAGVAGQFLPVIERLVPPRAARATHQIVRPNSPPPPPSLNPHSARVRDSDANDGAPAGRCCGFHRA
jgi:hypothetical protein